MDKRGSRRKNSARKQRAARAAADKPQGRLQRWTRRLLVWGGAIALLGALFIALAVAFAARSMPSYYQLKATQTAQTIVVRARDGTEIVELGPSFGKWLTSDEIPQVMKDAMISVEDRRFHSHFGIDPVRTGGAIIEGITGSRARVGGTSTISQQLARNVFLNNNRSIDRKAREAILAMALEWKFSKEQILELYLNKVYFGGGAYGIDSASRKFAEVGFVGGGDIGTDGAGGDGFLEFLAVVVVLGQPYAIAFQVFYVSPVEIHAGAMKQGVVMGDDRVAEVEMLE